MSTRYVAFGLELRSRFELPGMSPQQLAGLPTLTLELATPDELRSRWNGHGALERWRGRLGDGRELRIERAAAGEVMFDYAERASFLLSDDQRRLGCAPVAEGLDWQRVLLSKVLPSIAVMRGYEALHAAVVDSREGVIAIAGPSGSGKSTLALELMRRGLPLFADDELTLERHGDEVRAHAGTAHMNLPARLPADADASDLAAPLAILAGERWMAAESRSSGARPVRMICLLDRRPGVPAAVHELPANPLLLAPYVLGLSVDAGRARSRFCLYADLVERARLVRLSGALGSSPERLAELVDGALEAGPRELHAALGACA